FDTGARLSAINLRLLQKTRDRKSALERRAFVGAFTRAEKARRLSRVRARSRRARTGTFTRACPAARAKRAAPTLARHGRILRKHLSLRQTCARPTTGNGGICCTG